MHDVDEPKTKATFYLNAVIKYQHPPSQAGNWGQYVSKIEEILLEANQRLQAIFNEMNTSRSHMSFVPSYHKYLPGVGQYYYKIEMRYPSILSVHDLIQIDDEK